MLKFMKDGHIQNDSAPGDSSGKTPAAHSTTPRGRYNPIKIFASLPSRSDILVTADFSGDDVAIISN